jgi:hypothetical protein
MCKRLQHSNASALSALANSIITEQLNWRNDYQIAYVIPVKCIHDIPDELRTLFECGVLKLRSLMLYKIFRQRVVIHELSLSESLVK